MIGSLGIAAGWTGVLRLTRPITIPSAEAEGRLAWPDMRIELNRASAAELGLLPGIGPRLAERIVDDRAARGPFESVDDLARVPGVGPRLLERVRPYTINPTSGDHGPPIDRSGGVALRAWRAPRWHGWTDSAPSP